MRIDSVSSKPDRLGRYLIHFEDGTSIRLYRQTAEEFGIYAGLELSDRQLSCLRDSAGQMSAKMRAVRIVSAANVSKKDLQQRLIRKGESPDQAEEAVHWMEDLNLIDDRETARQIVQRCIHNGYGPSRARQALYEKKIPRQLWDEALEGYPDQNEYLVKFLQSRLGPESDRKDIKRAADALVRRGHRWTEIRRALSEITENIDDFLEE